MDTQPIISMHATLEKIVRYPHDPMTSAGAADCLGVHAKTVNDGVRLNKIEGTKQNLRRHGSSRRYRITKAALIRWLWQNEGGDKQTLRAAMEQLCPRILKSIDAEERPQTAKPKAANVIEFQPDFFLPPPAKQTS